MSPQSWWPGFILSCKNEVVIKEVADSQRTSVCGAASGLGGGEIGG